MSGLCNLSFGIHEILEQYVHATDPEGEQTESATGGKGRFIRETAEGISGVRRHWWRAYTVCFLRPVSFR